MKMRVWLITFGLVLCACNDDEEPEQNTAGSSAQQSDGGAFGTVTCDPNGSGACQNTDDCAAIASGTARSSAQSCGLGCIGNPDPAACSRGCVVQETSLSEGCADCYVGIVSCSFDHCVSACAVDADSQGCFDCQVDNGCRGTFDTCSGLPPVMRP